jgi:hypothetical protein
MNATLEKTEAVMPSSWGLDDDFRVRVLKELAKRARRVDCGEFEQDRYGFAYFHERLVDSLSDFDLLAFPVADSPLILAETIEHRGSTFLIGLKRSKGRLRPVFAELASEFRPL